MNEEWRDIKGYEGLYQVSNLGRIKSLQGWNGKQYIKREKILNPSIAYVKKEIPYKRLKVSLIKNKKVAHFSVHRLVAMTFIPNPHQYPVINHIDGNTFNNKVENLEWCTQKDNVHHARRTGLSIRPIDNISRELLVDMLNAGYTYDEISVKLQVAKGTIFKYIKNFKIKKIYE